MIQLNYIDLIRIKSAYETASTPDIKGNIKRLMKRNKVKHNEISDLLNITIHTAYSYTNKANTGKPDLINLLIIALFFNISIYDLLEPYKA